MDAQSCFRSMYADFQRQLNPADISADLYSAGLITETELEDVNNLMHSDTVRAAAMLKAVGRAINIEPGNFLKFLDILERVDRYKVTAQRAREMLGQQSPSSQYPTQKTRSNFQLMAVECKVAILNQALGMLGQQPPSSQAPRVGILNADISRVAGNLPQWQNVARKLGFGEQEIGYIETNSGSSEDQRKAFLRKWIGKNGISATYEKLCTVLLQLGEYGAAEKIGEIPPPPPTSEAPSIRIPNADISRVAGNLPQWQMVARKLGFGEQEIEYIEMNDGAPEDQRKAFLRKWIGKNGISATYYKLCTALLQLDEYGAAEKIREIPPPPPTSDAPNVGIPNADISRVAGNLPQWQMVARKLGFGEQEIGYIETNSGAPEDQRKAFLKKWIGKNGISATYYKLCTALLQLDEYGAAEKIREIPK